MDDRMKSCGAWTLGQEIGRGAYGVVYMAEGPDGERAAVKVCRRDAVGDECFEREKRGAELFSSLPPRKGLVRMRDLVETDWGFYTVLDLADDEFGGSSNSAEGYRPKTLARVIAGEKALPLTECVKLAISLADGLSVLQRHHLLHRDIKPGNVIYVGGCPVLSDPGLLIDESEAASLVGTPGYVPPEKFIDAASDIYSLGLTLKAASFGRQIDELDKGPAMESDTGAACFPVWWRILNKATDPIASRRYQSAKALLKDLQLLHLRMAFSMFSRKAPPAVKISVTGLIASAIYVMGFGLAKSGDSSGGGMEAVAGKIIDEFADMRTKEDMPDIHLGIRESYQSVLDMQRELLADKEKEIAELEDRIVADRKRIEEAEKRGDEDGKAAIEYGLASVEYRLKSAQMRKTELEKAVSELEEKLKKLEGEIGRADDERSKLRGCE